MVSGGPINTCSLFDIVALLDRPVVNLSIVGEKSRVALDGLRRRAFITVQLEMHGPIA